MTFVRYASTLFTPGRSASRAARALCLQCRNWQIRDQVSQPLPGEIRLQWWTDMLAGQGRHQDQDQDHGGAEGNPVAAELLRAIDAFRCQSSRFRA